MKSIKCVLVGEAAVGKSSLVLSYTTNAIPHAYVPTVFDNYSAHVTSHVGIVDLVIWDLGGSHDYQQLRPLAYKTAQIFLVAFSLDNRESFASVSSVWVPEIGTLGLPNTPWILVGTKADLRADPHWAPHLVKQEEASLLARQFNARQYLEVSSWTQEGLHELFQVAIRSVFRKEDDGPASSPHFCCSLL